MARGLGDLPDGEDDISHGSAPPEKDLQYPYPSKKPLPLIKTMYIRDPSRSQFQVKKYNRLSLEIDEDIMMEAFGDIKYDEFL